jgi:hypothetical protein
LRVVVDSARQAGVDLRQRRYYFQRISIENRAPAAGALRRGYHGAIRQREAVPADMAARSAPDIEGRWPYKSGEAADDGEGLEAAKELG